MIKTISLTNIKPNPFQSRKEIDKEAVKQLAEEIKTVGFWNTTLRVREHNSHYELVAGHRRLQALQLNGRSKLDIEVVELTDQEMAEQALIENLQREGLLEIDKAEAIARLVEISTRVEKRAAAIERLRQMLGYRDVSTIHDYLAMANLEPETRKAVRRANTGRFPARIARSLGGDDSDLANRMVRRLAQVPKPGEKGALPQPISAHELEEMRDAIKPLPEPQRKAVVERIASGKLHTPADVRRAATTELTKLGPKEPSPDLMLYIAKWRLDIITATERLERVMPFKDYIHKHPESVKEYRDAAKEYIRVATKLFNL